MLKLERTNQFNQEISDEEDKEVEDEEQDESTRVVMEKVFMLGDYKNFIYYIVKTKGLTRIMEINPRQSQTKNHTVICEMKQINCHGFQCTADGHRFYIIDD